MTEAVNTSTAGDQVEPVSATLANGGHVVAWTTTANGASAVMAQFYDAGGARVGGEVTLASGYSAGGIAALADGSFVVNLDQSAYGPGGSTSAVSFARFDASGRMIGAPVLIDGSGNNDVWLSAGDAFALANGGFALVETNTSRPVPWSTITHTIHEYDAAGNPVRTIAAGENWSPSTGGAVLAGGYYITTTQPYTGPGPSKLSWKVVDPAGNVTASGAQSGVYGQVDYVFPSVVALANGTGLVVWEANQYSNGTRSWQGQWIDAQGHAASTFTWDYQGGAPELTALAGGGFVATWTQSQSSSTYELFAQVFDASAHAAGNVQDIATLTQYAGGYDVTATADGGWLVDYQATANGQDIFEQKFGGSARGTVPGNSPMVGTPGLDTISLAGAHTDYAVTQHSIAGPQGTTSISSIERIVFGDHYAVALDVDGDAGKAYRLYKAAFDRAPDLGGLGYQMHDLDVGYSLSQVAANFIASPEFQSKYGVQDDAQFVTLLYQHVLARDPQQFEVQYHVDKELHAGYSRADVLTFFSESPENQANVIGQIQDGMLYAPVG